MKDATLGQLGINTSGVFRYQIRKYDPDQKEGVFYINYQQNPFKFNYSWTVGELKEKISEQLGLYGTLHLYGYAFNYNSPLDMKISDLKIPSGVSL